MWPYSSAHTMWNDSNRENTDGAIDNDERFEEGYYHGRKGAGSGGDDDG